MENKITISICGEEYTFIAEESPSYMQKVAALVDTKMSEVLKNAAKKFFKILRLFCNIMTDYSAA